MNWDLTQLAHYILVGVVCSVPCALLGCYLVLQRLSLLGDAISHAVLPGIALAYLLTGHVSGLPIVLGAMAMGLLTTFLTQTVQRLGKVPQDASMGVVFTSLFAIGVILITYAARGRASAHGGVADLDPGCVLYGQFEYASLNPLRLGGLEVPRPFPLLAVVCAGTVAFVVLLWKELKIVSFDPALATAMGINAVVVQYLLMAMVGGVTVAAFREVGSILIIAMLIVPAATAHLLTDRLVWMMLWAALAAVLAAVLGCGLAVVLDSNAAGLMAVFAGVQFLAAVLFAPRHGLLAKMIRNARLSLRIACEDVLARLYRVEEAAGRGEHPATLPTADARHAVRGWAGWLALPALRWRGEAQVGPQRQVGLTEAGRRRAESLVRAHRLWEAYLEQDLKLPLDHLHEPAERMEHYIGSDLQRELASRLNRPDTDPHGRVIPSLPDPKPAEQGPS